MRTLIIACTLLLLAGCSSATHPSYASPYNTASTATPVFVTPTPFAPSIPPGATQLTLNTIAGSYTGNDGKPLVFPSFSASTQNTVTISEFIQDVETLKSIFLNYCAVSSGYAVKITLSGAAGTTVWQGAATMDGCKDLTVGENDFSMTETVWNVLSRIAGRTLPFSPLDQQ